MELAGNNLNEVISFRNLHNLNYTENELLYLFLHFLK